jgi:RNA polymerase sigma-70 factor (ECF subfamily)
MTQPRLLDPPPSTTDALQSEEDLAVLLREAGHAVRSLLIRRFHGLLREADAEDVMVVALQRAWQHRARFDAARGSLRAWFFRIADHTAKDWLKRGWQKSRMLEVVPDEVFWDHVESRAPEQAPTVHPATREMVRGLIDALPEVQRRIIWADALCNDGGPASSDWLAAELGIPTGTVRVYRKRGLDRLRALMTERGLTKP